MNFTLISLGGDDDDRVTGRCVVGYGTVGGDGGDWVNGGYEFGFGYGFGVCPSGGAIPNMSLIFFSRSSS